MKSLSTICVLAACSSLFGSCAMVWPAGRTNGALVQSVRTGGEVVDVRGAPLLLEGLDTGEASEISLLGLISVGDSSVMAAAKEGGLKDVRYVDRSAFSFLGIFARYTTRVAGR